MLKREKQWTWEHSYACTSPLPKGKGVVNISENRICWLLTTKKIRERSCPKEIKLTFSFSSLFSCWLMSNSLQSHGLQHTRLPCPSPPLRVCSNSCALSHWYHPTISSPDIPFSSYLQFFPRLGVVPLNLEGWGKKRKMGKKWNWELLLIMMSAPWVNVKWIHSSDETGLGIQHISCTNNCLITSCIQGNVLLVGRSWVKMEMGSWRASQMALVLKNPPANSERVKRHSLNPWVRECPTPVFLPGARPHGQRSLVGCSPWVCKESGRIEHTQHFCRKREDPVDAWTVLHVGCFLLREGRQTEGEAVIHFFHTQSCRERYKSDGRPDSPLVMPMQTLHSMIFENMLTHLFILSGLGLHCCVQGAFSGGAVQASHCGGLSYCGVWTVGHMGSRSCHSQDPEQRLNSWWCMDSVAPR